METGWRVADGEVAPFFEDEKDGLVENGRGDGPITVELVVDEC